MSEEIKNTEGASAPASENTAPQAAAPQAASTRESAPAPREQRDQRPQRDSRDNNRGRKMPRFRKKVCKFCHNKELEIDYKKPDVLLRFITDRGKILPRRITGTCAKHQRRVAAEIKRARTIALLPFVEQ